MDDNDKDILIRALRRELKDQRLRIYKYVDEIAELRARNDVLEYRITQIHNLTDNR